MASTTGPTSDEKNEGESSLMTRDVDDDQEDKDKNNLCKYGIVYLGYIPEGLNVKILRDIMGQFGDVGRIYLEPERKSKKHLTYTEGWVEFKKKRVAKSVAKTLNGMPLQYGRKRCKMNGQIWSMKYLHRFKWAHLTEQLIHDKAVRDQKRRFEMSQTKKQVDFYQKMIQRSKYSGNSQSKHGNDERVDRTRQRQVPTSSNTHVDDDLLASIFKKVS